MHTDCSDTSSSGLTELTSTEWKIANRLGAYACSSAVCMNTRRNQGLLVAPITRGAPKMVLLSRAEETVVTPAGARHELACNQYPGVVAPRGDQYLRDFSSSPAPTWVYSADGWTLEKRLHLLDDRNVVLLSYRLTGAPIDLLVRPLFALRPQWGLMYQWNGRLAAEKCTKQDYHLPATGRTPEVFFSFDGAFDPKGYWYYNTIYRGTADGEGNGLEDLWCPGQVKWALTPSQSAHFVCSTDPVQIPAVLETVRQATRRTVVARVSELTARHPVGAPVGDKHNPDPRTPGSTHPVRAS